MSLYLAWKGVADDNRIFYATALDGHNWSDQHLTTAGGTSDGPALAYDGKRVVMAWKGVADDSRIFYAMFDGNMPPGQNWGPQYPATVGGTSNSPALSNYGDQAIMAWKGVGADTRIFYATFDGHMPPGQNWGQQQLTTAGGTSDSPAVLLHFP